MIIKIKNKFKSILKTLFIEDHDPLEAIGISVRDISERVEKSKRGNKRDIEDIKHDIDFALEFSDVISKEDKQGLEKLKVRIQSM